MPTRNWAVLFTVLTISLAWTAATISPTLVIVWYAALFAPYLVLLSRVGDPVWSWKHIVGLAIGVRLALIFADPLLSFDISRYVFEGRVTLDGVNPFVDSPMSFNVRHLRDDVIWESINHKHLAAIYPPGSQMFFALVAALGGGWSLMKAAFVVVEILGGLLVWKLFKDRWTVEHFERGLSVYALNPLVINEVAWSGHLDVLAWVPLAIALMWIADRETWKSHLGAGALLGISITMKFLGVVLLPYLLLRRTDNWKIAIPHRLAMFAIMAVVVTATYLPFAGAGSSLFGSFGKYAASWQNNEGYFRLFERTAKETLRFQKSERDPMVSFPQYDSTALKYGVTKQWNGETIPNTSFATKQLANVFAKLVAAMLMAFVLLGCLVLVRDPVRGTSILLLALYCVAPTVHPWYVAWLVPLAVWKRDHTVIAFSIFCLLGYTSWVSLSSGGKWAIPDWVLILEYGALTYVVLQSRSSKIARFFGG